MPMNSYSCKSLKTQKRVEMEVSCDGDRELGTPKIYNINI